MTKLKKLEKGSNKIEKYFPNIKQQFNFQNVENSNNTTNNNKNYNLNESNSTLWFLRDKNIPNSINTNCQILNNKINVNFNKIAIANKLKFLKQSSYTTIFENETIHNETYFSNKTSNRLNTSKSSRISNSKDKEKEELNYQNFYKNSFLKNRNYISSSSSNNLNCVNFNNQISNSNLSLHESSNQNVNYLYANSLHNNNTNNNYFTNKFVNINSNISQLKTSTNQSFEENQSQNRKSSNVTFGFPCSNNTNPNNLNNSNIFNSSLMLNHTNNFNNNTSMSIGSNTYLEVLYDELNNNMNFNSNMLVKQNSGETNISNNDICNSENNLNVQSSNSNMLVNVNNQDFLLNQKTYVNGECIVLSPSQNLLNNNQDNFSKISSGDLNSRIKKPTRSSNYTSFPPISSSKSTNHSVISNSNNSQFSLTHQKSTGNLNTNSNFEIMNNHNYNNVYNSKENLNASIKKISLSFADNDSNLLNSSMNNDTQSINDSENKKSKYSYGGLNTLLHSRIDNLPKTKKAKNGSSNKKIKNSKQFGTKYIDLVFSKLIDPLMKASEKNLKNKNDPNNNKEFSNKINTDNSNQNLEIYEKIKNFNNNGRSSNSNNRSSSNLKNSNDRESLALNEDIDNELLESKSRYQIRDESKSLDTNNKIINSDKAGNLRDITHMKFYNKHNLLKESPEIARSSGGLNSSGKKYTKNDSIKKYLSNEKIKNNNNINNNIIEKHELVNEIYCDGAINTKYPKLKETNLNFGNEKIHEINNLSENENYENKINNKRERKHITIFNKEETQNKNIIYQKDFLLHDDNNNQVEKKIKVSNFDEIKEITKDNFGESLKKIIMKKEETLNLNSNTKISNKKSINLDTCPTTASGENSIIKTRSAKLKIETLKNSEKFLNKKRKSKKLIEKSEEFENNENNKNANNVDNSKHKIYKNNRNSKNKYNINTLQNDDIDETTCKNLRNLSNNSRRKMSMASNTGDEIIAFQTPVKIQEINNLKHSPNAVSRKNLMELFAQIKKV